MAKLNPDRPLSLWDLGFRLIPMRGEKNKVHTYIAPYGVHIDVHPNATHVPEDGSFGRKSTFTFPGGIRVIDGVIHALAHGANQMWIPVPLHLRIFSREVRPANPRKHSAEELLDRLKRNRKRPERFLPTQTVHFPKWYWLSSDK